MMLWRSLTARTICDAVDAVAAHKAAKKSAAANKPDANHSKDENLRRDGAVGNRPGNQSQS